MCYTQFGGAEKIKQTINASGKEKQIQNYPVIYSTINYILKRGT